MPGQAVETPGVDDVTPLGRSAAAEQTLWSSDFWRDCMAPKIVTFKVPTGVLSLLMVSPRALLQTLMLRQFRCRTVTGALTQAVLETPGSIV